MYLINENLERGEDETCRGYNCGSEEREDRGDREDWKHCRCFFFFFLNLPSMSCLDSNPERCSDTMAPCLSSHPLHFTCLLRDMPSCPVISYIRHYIVSGGAITRVHSLSLPPSLSHTTIPAGRILTSCDAEITLRLTLLTSASGAIEADQSATGAKTTLDIFLKPGRSPTAHLWQTERP